MEDSHAKGATQQALNVVDRAVYNAANNLEEAWAWGFETDVWRAHLSALTWPEVLRQLGVAVGRGRRRPNPQDAAILVGQEGEDTVEDVAECLKLKLPSRVAPGCVKACVWQVLAR